MKEELIFHLVSEETWKDAQDSGEYRPEVYHEKGFIPCAGGKDVQKIANEQYLEITDLLLLVIDPTRVNAKVSYDESSDSGPVRPYIAGALNNDAVIDKIQLSKNEEGKYEIEVSTD